MSPQRVRVVVAEWEIGCCAPEPVIGAPTTWTLQHALAGPEPDPLLDEEHEWAVDGDGVLHRGAVTAHPVGGGRVPAPGLVVLRGRLWGTVHVDPAEFPPVTGRVERMRLLRHRWRPGPDGGSEEVPGSVTAHDLAEFDMAAYDRPGPADAGDPFAVLLDVVLHPGSAPPPSG